MLDSQKAEHKIMKMLAPFTKLEPDQRTKKSMEIVEKYNKESKKTEALIKIGEPKDMEGYVLDRPELTFTGTKTKPDERGNLKVRNKLKAAKKITDWLFVYSLGKKPDMDDDEADRAVSNLRKAGETYGITYDDPGFLTIEGNGSKRWVD